MLASSSPSLTCTTKRARRRSSAPTHSESRSRRDDGIVHLQRPGASDALGPTTERECFVFVRVVRFTDVSAERMKGLLAQIEASDGPPPGVPATGLQVLFDQDQET